VKQIGDAPGRVVGDAGEQVGEIELRVEAAGGRDPANGRSSRT
jgi:hypothetical protein